MNDDFGIMILDGGKVAPSDRCHPGGQKTPPPSPLKGGASSPFIKGTKVAEDSNPERVADNCPG